MYGERTFRSAIRSADRQVRRLAACRPALYRPSLKETVQQRMLISVRRTRISVPSDLIHANVSLPCAPTSQMCVPGSLTCARWLLIRVPSELIHATTSLITVTLTLIDAPAWLTGGLSQLIALRLD